MRARSSSLENVLRIDAICRGGKRWPGHVRGSGVAGVSEAAREARAFGVVANGNGARAYLASWNVSALLRPRSHKRRKKRVPNRLDEIRQEIALASRMLAF